MDRASQRSLVEVACVVVLIGAFLWFGRRAFPGADLVFVATLLALLLYLHRQAGESARELGFRWDTFWPTSRLLLPVVVGGGALIWSASLVLRKLGSPPPATTDISKAVFFVAFGLAQQYVMLGFILKRVERLASVGFATVITAVLFALLHLPNVFLTAVTLLWGLICCLVYRRSPNLWANGLAHGLLAAMLYYELPRSVTGGLYVGMEYVGFVTGR